MAEKSYDVRIDNAKVLRILVDNLCTITKEQLAELVRKQLKRGHSQYEYQESILLTTIKREKKRGLYRTENILNGEDFIISPFGEKGNLSVIPCFWVLQDMFKDEYLNISNVFRGKNPETLSYSTDNITYSFYHITEDTLGILPKSIERANLYASLSANTRDVKYHLINIYVTDSVEIADLISEATKDLRCQIAITRTEKSPYEKPSEIAYIVDGKRVK